MICIDDKIFIVEHSLRLQNNALVSCHLKRAHLLYKRLCLSLTPNFEEYKFQILAYCVSLYVSASYMGRQDVRLWCR